MERFKLLGADAQIKVTALARAAKVDASAFEAWVSENETAIYRSLDLQKLENLLGARKQDLLKAYNNGADYSARFVSERLDVYEEQLRNIEKLRKKLNL